MIIIVLILLTVLCLLGWLSLIPIWTVRRSNFDGIPPYSFKINSIDKFEGMTF